MFVTLADKDSIGSLQVNADGSLSNLLAVGSGGTTPVHAHVIQNRVLLVANYHGPDDATGPGGSVASFLIDDSVNFLPLSSLFTFSSLFASLSSFLSLFPSFLPFLLFSLFSLTSLFSHLLFSSLSFLSLRSLSSLSRSFLYFWKSVYVFLLDIWISQRNVEINLVWIRRIFCYLA